MFDSAYLKLTAWYVTIIMAISVLFSVWIYREATLELQTGFERQGTALQQPLYSMPEKLQIIRSVAADQLEASRARLLANLVYLNLLVLGVGGAASYVLAKRTMRPIEDALEAQNRFTADASHELRTPLTAMKTEIEVSLRDQDLSVKEAKKLLQSNLEEIDRLTSLAEDLLVLASDNKAQPPQPVNLGPLINQVSKRLKPLADSRRIIIKQQLRALQVVSDEAHLDKIIGILLDNAIKYSPEGKAVTITTSIQGSNGQLIIADEGVGIKGVDLPHIFERFYRADTARSKEKIAGHGLGLSIAKKLTEQLGGEIVVESEAGKGSTFTITLPLNQKS